MGGKRWRDYEEKVFWEVIVPLAPPGHDAVSQQAKGKTEDEDEEWGELAERMKEEMLARFPGEALLRKYDHVLCYEHYFQNFKKRNYSPNAKPFVDAYRAKLARDIEMNGQAPESPQDSSPSVAAQATKAKKKTKSARGTPSKDRRKQKATRRMASAQSKQQKKTNLADEGPDEDEKDEDDDDEGDDTSKGPAQSVADNLAQPDFGSVLPGYGNGQNQMPYYQPGPFYNPYGLQNPFLAQQASLAAFQASRGIYPGGFQPYGFPPAAPRQGLGTGHGGQVASPSQAPSSPAAATTAATTTSSSSSSQDTTTTAATAATGLGLGRGFAGAAMPPYALASLLLRGGGAQRPVQAADAALFGMGPFPGVGGPGSVYAYNHNRGLGAAAPFPAAGQTGLAPTPATAPSGPVGGGKDEGAAAAAAGAAGGLGADQDESGPKTS